MGIQYRRWLTTRLIASRLTAGIMRESGRFTPVQAQRKANRNTLTAIPSDRTVQAPGPNETVLISLCILLGTLVVIESQRLVQAHSNWSTTHAHQDNHEIVHHRTASSLSKLKANEGVHKNSCPGIIEICNVADPAPLAIHHRQEKQCTDRQIRVNFTRAVKAHDFSSVSDQDNIFRDNF